MPTLLGAGSDSTLPSIAARLLAERGVAIRELVEAGIPSGICIQIFALLVALLAGVGASMGMAGGWRQVLAGAVKVPAMILLSLAICFPALMAASMLLGARLEGGAVLTLFLLCALLQALVLASLLPVSVFFTMISRYRFIKLYYVATFAASSMIAMHAGRTAVLLLAGDTASVLDSAITGWATVYALVGAQVAWLLRPMIGSPGLNFEWVRRGETELNFYTAIMIAFDKKSDDSAAKSARKPVTGFRPTDLPDSAGSTPA